MAVTPGNPCQELGRNCLHELAPTRQKALGCIVCQGEKRGQSDALSVVSDEHVFILMPESLPTSIVDDIIAGDGLKLEFCFGQAALAASLCLHLVPRSCSERSYDYAVHMLSPFGRQFPARAISGAGFPTMR